jgi:hypothetical protein
VHPLPLVQMLSMTADEQLRLTVAGENHAAKRKPCSNL